MVYDNQCIIKWWGTCARQMLHRWRACLSEQLTQCVGSVGCHGIQTRHRQFMHQTCHAYCWNKRYIRPLSLLPCYLVTRWLMVLLWRRVVCGVLLERKRGRKMYTQLQRSDVMSYFVDLISPNSQDLTNNKSHIYICIAYQTARCLDVLKLLSIWLLGIGLEWVENRDILLQKWWLLSWLLCKFCY